LQVNTLYCSKKSNEHKEFIYNYKTNHELINNNSKNIGLDDTQKKEKNDMSKDKNSKTMEEIKEIVLLIKMTRKNQIKKHHHLS